ncbi:hypothetical protein FBUS_08240 [Fasciolopsis buskii]|uniref:Uncharacterized protein n=1 Tax=Fasciolopsis buskii TaxID=27845 RepID=A0A8E0RRQ4_9TREM|nr:hypothetical protein FBUS_08240 [Fasciolopsis buski]
MTKSGILLIKQHGFLEVLLDMLHECDSSALHFALESLVAVIRSGMFSNVVVSSDTLNSLCYLTLSQKDAKRTMALYILQHILKGEGMPKCPPGMTNHLPCLLSLVVEPSVHKNSAPLDNRDSVTGANNIKAKSHTPTDLYTLAQAVCCPSPEMIFDLVPVTICAASCLASLASTSDAAVLMRTNGGIPILVSCLR